MTPVEASKKENEVRVYRHLYPDLTRRPMRAKFKTGGRSSNSQEERIFWKGFHPKLNRRSIHRYKNSKNQPSYLQN